MNRQELSEMLQKISKVLKPSATMYVNGIPAQKVFQIDDSGKYVVFVVPMLADPDAAESCAARHPDWTVITVPPNQSIDEAIWHFQIKNLH